MSSSNLNGYHNHRHYHRQDLHQLDDEEGGGGGGEGEECPLQLQSSPRPPERIESRYAEWKKNNCPFAYYVNAAVLFLMLKKSRSVLVPQLIAYFSSIDLLSLKHLI